MGDDDAVESWKRMSIFYGGIIVAESERGMRTIADAAAVGGNRGWRRRVVAVAGHCIVDR